MISICHTNANRLCSENGDKKFENKRERQKKSPNVTRLNRRGFGTVVGGGELVKVSGSRANDTSRQISPAQTQKTGRLCVIYTAGRFPFNVLIGWIVDRAFGSITRWARCGQTGLPPDPIAHLQVFLELDR